MLDIAIDELAPRELPFLFNSWTLSFRGANDQTRALPKDPYCRLQRDVIDSILERYPLVLVARSARHPDVIYGWICAEPSEPGIVVHYTYVKSAYRQARVASRLLAAALQQLSPQSGPGLFYTQGVDRWTRRLARMGLEYVPIEQVLRASRKGAA